jgi:hypothetical protein
MRCLTLGVASVCECFLIFRLAVGFFLMERENCVCVSNFIFLLPFAVAFNSYILWREYLYGLFKIS